MNDYEPKVLDIEKDIYGYRTAPCDFWDGIALADEFERKVILSLMPDEPRDYTVYKSYLPGNGYDLEVFYFCKGDNNGDTYIFSNCPIKLTLHPDHIDTTWGLCDVIRFKKEKVVG